jgi:uncharacterized phage protein (TIGR01671 family)
MNFVNSISSNINSLNVAPFGIDDLMQSTGLRDKNGVLIFEGDIIKTRSDWNNGISEQWCDSCTSSIKYDDGQCWSDSGLDDWYNGCEVIGNIYENPELLESE